MERILITGASGFIGSHLVAQALSEGYEVWVAVRPESRPPKDPQVHAVSINYFDEESIAQTIAQHEHEGQPAWHYVIHNAGVTKTADTKEFYEVNAEHTRRLSTAFARAQHPPKRFLLMSSLSSYGAAGNATDPIRITDPQRPNTEYGRSKLLAEQYLRATGLPYTMLLPTGVYGPGDKDYRLAIESVISGMHTMPGFTPQQLTFVYGGDVARAALFLIKQPQAENKSYIISDGDVWTDRQFGKLIQELSGTKRVFYLRLPLFLVRGVCAFGSLYSKLTGKTTPLNNDKYPMIAQRNWRCDASPLFELGFRPQYDLRRGLSETIQSIRK